MLFGLQSFFHSVHSQRVGECLKLIVFYNGEFGARVVGNLINYSGFCISCGEACTQCRNVRPGYAEDIVALMEMPDPSSLGDFIEDVDPYLPKDIPQADIAIVMNVHPDILFGLLPKLKEAGVKGIIGCSEKPKELPLGQRKQLEELGANLGIETAFAKPFCAMRPDPAKPNIAAFLEKAGIGDPLIEVALQKSREGKNHIVAANVVRSAPCGSTWFVAKRLLGLEPDQPDIRERISEAHHAYPCTASMDRDTELGDTILHKGGYIIRDAVENAFKKAKHLD
jgi:thymidylate synthase